MEKLLLSTRGKVFTLQSMCELEDHTRPAEFRSPSSGALRLRWSTRWDTVASANFRGCLAFHRGCRLNG